MYALGFQHTQKPKAHIVIWNKNRLLTKVVLTKITIKGIWNYYLTATNTVVFFSPDFSNALI